MFQNFFSFEGRIRRSEFFVGRLLMYFALFAVVSISTIFKNSALNWVIIMIGGAGLLYCVVAQSAKRCHDMGCSGWFQLIPLFGLVMLFADGQPYENEYGPDPKGRDGIRAVPPDQFTDILDSERYK